MKATPRGLRLHVGLFGRRNVGKSSLLNAITRQAVSIVSPQAGTTTDPVEKPMELLPLGPVLFVDTAGIDDEGALGALRIEKTRRVIDRVDLGVIVVDAASGAQAWGPFEDALAQELRTRETPVIVALNKTDTAPADLSLVARLRGAGHAVVALSALRGDGLDALREALIGATPADFFDARRLIADLVPPGGLCVLVVPIDKEAPKGRLILPQVMAIRDLLDGDAMALVVKERELAPALRRLTEPPSLVVTDSQAFLKVTADVPPAVPMTSFSILMARLQGDLVEQTRGTRGIDGLSGGARVLVAETCTHHPIGEDIGRVKIPRWLTQYAGAPLQFEHVAGRDFPADVSPYALVVHCGNCTGNRREMLSRIARCRAAGVPITNYGLAIAFSLGILERALAPFPAALDALRSGS